MIFHKSQIFKNWPITFSLISLCILQLKPKFYQYLALGMNEPDEQELSHGDNSYPTDTQTAVCGMSRHPVQLHTERQR